MFTIAEAMKGAKVLGLNREPESPSDREARLLREIRLTERYLEGLKKDLAALELEEA